MPRPRDVLELIERMRCVSSEAECGSLLASLGAVERPTILSFLNAHAVNVCMASDPALAAFRTSDILLRDGVGLQAVLPWLGQPTGLNMNGTDFIPRLLRTLSARKIAVYGTATPWLERARAMLESSTPHHYTDFQHGFHPIEHYIAQARVNQPDVILLAMGMPRQEQVAALLKRALDHPVLIVNGGAIVDFLAGRFKRAPETVQKSGLEWAFRLVQEPKRLFRRYCVGAFGFARTVFLLHRAASLRSSASRSSASRSSGSTAAVPQAPMHKEL